MPLSPLVLVHDEYRLDSYFGKLAAKLIFQRSFLFKSVHNNSHRQVGKMLAGSQTSREETAIEYQAPFVFPVIKPEEGQPAVKHLRLVAGYSSGEHSGEWKCLLSE